MSSLSTTVDAPATEGPIAGGTMSGGTPDVSRFAETFYSITQNIEKVIHGQRDAVYHTLLCLVAGGHLLLTDAPGVGKTSLAKALACSLNLEFRRIQSTSDLLPSDVLGVNIWHQSNQEFVFHQGPVFSNLVLVDEINRTSPKTQSALLEAMAEQQVTIDGTRHYLPSPFMVVATQNPLEQEGTYPLPESQLDRFLMRLHLGYPDPSSEMMILNTHGKSPSGDAIEDLEAVAAQSDLLEMSKIREQISIDLEVQRYLIGIATATRQNPSLVLGMSPRATLSLQRLAQARAASQNRGFVIPDDVKALAHVTLCHRLVLRHDAQRRGVTREAVVDSVLQSVPVPLIGA